MTKDPVIAVVDEAFGGVDVVVSPSPEGIGHDRGFVGHAEAIAYATRLSVATGWPIVDRSSGARP